MTQINPTVGRKVYFYADEVQEQPHDATVIKVMGHGPHAPVNLLVIDPDSGATRIERNVTVGDTETDIPHYRWMPYQMGQAARTEHAERSVPAVERKD